MFSIARVVEYLLKKILRVVAVIFAVQFLVQWGQVFVGPTDMAHTVISFLVLWAVIHYYKMPIDESSKRVKNEG